MITATRDETVIDAAWKQTSDAAKGLPFDASAVGLALYVGAFALWCGLGGGTERTQAIVGGAAVLPMNALAVYFAWRVARGSLHSRTVRRFWIVVGAAYVLWGLGHVAWFAHAVGLRLSPFPSIGDVGRLAFYPTLAAGLLMLMGGFGNGKQRIRSILDLSTVGLSAALVVWHVVVEPTTRQGDASGLAQALSIFYPVGDVLLISCAVAVRLRQQTTTRTRPVLFLLAGVALFVIADIAYARLSLDGSYAVGDWPDAVWLAAQALFVLAAISQSRGSAYARTHDEDLPHVSVLPGAATMTAYVVAATMAMSSSSANPRTMLAGLVVITVIVLVRQHLTVADNHALLVAAQATAQRSQQFLADASHQLRTPIAGIQVCAELLADPHSADHPELLEGIARETRRATRLVTNLVTTARLDGSNAVRRAPVVLVHICEEEAERARRLAPELTIVGPAEDGPEAGALDLDEAAVREVVANLLDNARRFARSRIEISLRIERRVAVVAVTDDGPGVDPSQAEAIFERFVTLHGGGSGLGLAIARDLTRLHGGDLTYDAGTFVARFSTAE